MNPLTYAVRPAVQLGFRVLAAGRRARAFHPAGLDVEGTAWPLHNDVVTLVDGPVPVVGRLSKGAGLPGDLPDVLGIALRLACHSDGAFDVLLSSAGEGRLSRRLPLLSRSWHDAWLTSIQPYGDGTRRIWLAAQVTPGAVPLPANSLASLRRRIAAAPLTVLLSASDGGPWTPVAHVDLTLDLTPDVAGNLAPGDLAPGGPRVRFDPVLNPPPGLRLRPEWLTSVREAAYVGSRRGATRA